MTPYIIRDKKIPITVTLGQFSQQLFKRIIGGKSCEHKKGPYLHRPKLIEFHKNMGQKSNEKKNVTRVTKA